MPEPTWRLTIDIGGDVQIVPGATPNVWVVTGRGERPLLEILARPVDPPPPPPPVGSVLDPYPGEDVSAFVWPAGGPQHPSDPNGDRQYALGMAAPVNWWFHANIQGAGRPSPQYQWAGLIAPDGITDYRWEVGSMNLWALIAEDFEDPLTSLRIPPPPGYLIRRALKHGRVTGGT